MDLKSIGCPADLLDRRAALSAAGLTLGRVASEHRDSYDVLTEHGQVVGRMSGRFRHRIRSPIDRPAVGDWVSMQVPEGGGPAILSEVLPRRNEFVRRATGIRTEAQMMATNLDVVFVVSNQESPLSRQIIERYLALVQPLDVQAVVLLNKSELAGDPRRAVEELVQILPGIPVHAIRALGGQDAIEDGATVVRRYLDGRLTGAVLGPSGAGKSTLVNRVMGTDEMATAAVREADRQGRHTTVHRQLMAVPTGGVIIDTPGMRALQPWAEEEGVAATFADIEELALECRFKNCGHGGEDGCAVQASIAAGQMEAARLEDYKTLAKEGLKLSHEKREKAHSDERKRLKKANRNARMAMEIREGRGQR